MSPPTYERAHAQRVKRSKQRVCSLSAPEFFHAILFILHYYYYYYYLLFISSIIIIHTMLIIHNEMRCAPTRALRQQMQCNKCTMFMSIALSPYLLRVVYIYLYYIHIIFIYYSYYLFIFIIIHIHDIYYVLRGVQWVWEPTQRAWEQECTVQHKYLILLFFFFFECNPEAVQVRQRPQSLVWPYSHIHIQKQTQRGNVKCRRKMKWYLQNENEAKMWGVWWNAGMKWNVCVNECNSQLKICTCRPQMCKMQRCVKWKWQNE